LGITGLLSFFDGIIFSIFIILLAAYGVYLLLASMTTAWHVGLKYLPVLPVAFLTMQLSFGAGFLIGLFKSHH